MLSLASCRIPRVREYPRGTVKFVARTPPAINRRQRSTALDTEQGRTRARSEPYDLGSSFSPSFRLLTVKAATSRNRGRRSESALFMTLFRRANRAGTPRVYSTLKSSVSLSIDRANTATRTGQLHPRLTYSARSRFVGPPDERWQVDFESSGGTFLRPRKCSLSSPGEAETCSIKDKKERTAGREGRTSVPFIYSKRRRRTSELTP